MKAGLVFSLLALSLVLPNLAFAEEGTSSVEADGTTYEVSYDATGLVVDGIEADTSTGTLIVLVTTEDVTASLEVTLERSFFDSQTDGADDEFLVLADGIDTPFEEAKTDSSRTLTISVPSGTSSLDIIALGTTSFGATLEETPQEVPEETPIEEPEVPQEEPEVQCGPGTVLKDRVCVLEVVEPQEEAPAEEPEEVPEPQTQCGPGTILKDGVCVLDERCGPGTIFKDGQCVLEEAPQETKAAGSGAFQLVAPAVAAFSIAFIIMIVLWAIGKASGKKTS